jgi:uncharacterized protein (TIGR02996 family)
VLAEQLLLRSSVMTAPKNQQAALLAAIHDQPDDDGPRLRFANWLEELGDSRSEFIRVQCAIACLDENDPRREELEQKHLAELSRLQELCRTVAAAMSIPKESGAIGEPSTGVARLEDVCDGDAGQRQQNLGPKFVYRYNRYTDYIHISLLSK